MIIYCRLVIFLGCLMGLTGCVSTEELYARYDSQLCATAPATGMPWHTAIVFPYNQSVVTEEEEKKLEDNLSLLITHTDYRVVLRGFADSVGSQRYNLPLSKQRAEFIAEWFEARGVAGQRIDGVGLGKDLLLITPSAGHDERANRRVELLLVDREGQAVTLTESVKSSVQGV